MSETPDPTRLKHEDEALRAIMEAFDESSGCDEVPSVRDFCCQWNNRTPCAECANLERRVRQALRDTCADLQAENARLTAALAESQRLHMELLYQVAVKHPDETRHETAKRYLRLHVNHCNQGGPSAALTPKGETHE